MAELFAALAVLHWADEAWLLGGLLAGRFGARPVELEQRRIAVGKGSVLQTREVIHAYPGKRLILRGQLDGTEVVAKFYLGRLAGLWEWYRGLRGSRALATSKVQAPAVMHAGYCRLARAWLTILEHVPVDEAWPPSSPFSDALNARIVETLHQHHLSGIVQNDLNWTNFLPHNGVLWSIDGDRVRRYRAPLARRRAFDNLMRLYAYKTRFTEEQIVAGFEQYCQLRGWPATDERRQAFLRAVHTARRDVAKRVAGRSLRGWKHFRPARAGRHRSIVDRRRLPKPLHSLLLEPKTWMGTATRSSVGSLVTLGDHPLRVRHIARDSYLGALAGLIRGSRPVRAWTKAVLLRRLRIPVDAPVALIEERLGPLRREGYLLQRAEETVRLPTALPGLDNDQRRDLLQDMGRVLKRLRDARLTHQRLGLEAWGVRHGQIVLVDIDGLRGYPRWLPAFDRVWERDAGRLREEVCERFGLPPEEARQWLMRGHDRA
ncbi:hypothetical protein J2T57_000267 [Natronocella acetinitrilica]|uniref:Lipopolysaccharide kinase (Kdo/WaaP) family protein n=1 Tax=Natronocella acetinitrilica TaxID=414046 RepID=A0AAE3K9V1_9GAMM|nr:hypothetical protein [Natronocella acetinitrilica]MCP1673175.1 hypothetical protein [Natronocella acetinitrilica]